MAHSEAYNSEFFSVTFPAEHVAHVEINRPKKLNAFKDPMWGHMNKIFEALNTDPSVRAIVLSGRGEKAFTAGLDVQAASQDSPLSNFPKHDPGRAAFALRRHILEIQETVNPIERGTKPVVVVLHGYSFGLAIDISSACDVRIATKDVKLSVKETEIGLAADVGTLSRLPKLGVSLSWVKDICYTSRIFGADEALRVGFVSRVVENREEGIAAAIELAKNMALKSPVALQGTKHLIDYSRDHTTREGLEYTAVWNSVMLQSEDVGKAMMSGLTKQKPSFSKL